MTGRIIREGAEIERALADKAPELTGVAEINQDWMGRMGNTNDEEDEDAAEEEEEIIKDIKKAQGGQTEEDESSAEEEEEGGEEESSPKEEPPVEPKRYERKRYLNPEGLSTQEGKALHKFDPENNKSDEVKEAFLCGFRMKQDYISISLKEQADQLAKITDALTSASLAVTRAATDIVDATNLSTSKLAAAVTTTVAKTVKTSDEKKPPSGKATEKSITSSKKSAPKKTKIEDPVEGEETSKTQEKDTKETKGSVKSSSLKMKEIVDAGPSEIRSIGVLQEPIINPEQVVKIMGCTKETLLSFYGIEEDEMKTLCQMIGKSNKDLLKEFGGVGGAKGLIKTILNTMKK